MNYINDAFINAILADATYALNTNGLDGLPSQDLFDYLKTRMTPALAKYISDTSEGDSLYFLDPDGHKLEIHCGDLRSRLDSLKEKPYKGLIWY